MAYEQRTLQEMATFSGPQTIYSDMVDLGSYSAITGVVDLNTIVGGGATLTVFLESSLDSRIWVPVWTSLPLAAAGATPFAASIFTNNVLLRYLRSRSEIAGPAGTTTTFSIRALLRD